MNGADLKSKSENTMFIGKTGDVTYQVFRTFKSDITEHWSWKIDAPQGITAGGNCESSGDAFEIVATVLSVPPMSGYVPVA